MLSQLVGDTSVNSPSSRTPTPSWAKTAGSLRSPAVMRVCPPRGRRHRHEEIPQVPFGHQRLCLFAAFGDRGL